MGRYSPDLPGGSKFSWADGLDNLQIPHVSGNSSIKLTPDTPDAEAISAIEDAIARLEVKSVRVFNEADGSISPTGWRKIGEELSNDFRANTDSFEAYNNVVKGLKRMALSKVDGTINSSASSAEAIEILVGMFQSKKYDTPAADVPTEAIAAGANIDADAKMFRMLRGDRDVNVPLSEGYACPKAGDRNSMDAISSMTMAKMIDSGPDGAMAIHKGIKQVIGDNPTLNAPDDVEMDVKSTKSPPLTDNGRDAMMQVFQIFQGHELNKALGLTGTKSSDLAKAYLEGGPRSRISGESHVQLPVNTGDLDKDAADKLLAEAAKHSATQDRQVAFMVDHLLAQPTPLSDEWIANLAGTSKDMVSNNLRTQMRDMQKAFSKGYGDLDDADKQIWASWTAMRQDLCGSVSACMFYAFVFGAVGYGIGYAVDQTNKQEEEERECRDMCTPTSIRQGLIEPVAGGSYSDWSWDSEVMAGGDAAHIPKSTDNCWFDYLDASRAEDSTMTCAGDSYCNWCESLTDGWRSNFVTGFSDPFRLAGEGAGFMGGLVAETSIAAGMPFMEEMTGLLGTLMSDLFGGMGVIMVVVVVVVLVVVVMNMAG